MDLQINPKFKEILPILSEEEYKHLETSLINEGCRDAVLIWKNQIVDGHNRAEICTKHQIAFRANEMAFSDEDEALEWMLTNQLGRRNVSQQQKALYISQIYELQKKRHGDVERLATEAKNEENASVFPSDQNDHLEDSEPEPKELAYEIEPQFIKKSVKTRDVVAKQLGVSPAKVQRSVAVSRALDTLAPEVKTDFLAGKVTQKAVIEQAREIKTPIVDDEAKDEFTKLAKKHASILVKILNDYESAVANAGHDFKPYGLQFRDFCVRLNSFHQGNPEPLLQLLTEAEMLKRLNKCPKCNAGRCERCSQKGYVFGEDRNDILREMGLKQ